MQSNLACILLPPEWDARPCSSMSSVPIIHFNLFVQNADSTSQRINHYPVLEIVLWVQYVVVVVVVVVIVQAIELSSG